MTYSVRDALALCGLNNVNLFHGETQAQRVASEVFGDDFHLCRDKTGDELKEDIKAYTIRMHAPFMYIYILKHTIHSWLCCPVRCSTPSMDTYSVSRFLWGCGFDPHIIEDKPFPIPSTQLRHPRVLQFYHIDWGSNVVASNTKRVTCLRQCNLHATIA